MTTSPSLVVTKQSSRRIAMAGAIGTILEWYDYGLYGTASALVITPLFFPNLKGLVGQLAGLATFAVGFVARPLGGILLGMLGDRIGRKKTLLLTIVVMGISTILIGVLPTYAQVGVLAPMLLVILRLIQGFGAGAELAGALTYVSESSERSRKGFYSAFSSAATVGGTFISTAIFAIVTAVTTQKQLLSWGWRIPFLLSAVILVFSYVLRARLEDSPEFKRLQELAEAKQVRRRVPLWDMLRNDTRSFFAAFLAPTAVGVVAYVTTVFSVSYIVGTLKMPKTLSLVVILTATGVGMLTAPLFGMLADKVGAKRVFLGGSLFGALFAFPYFFMLTTKSPALVVLAAVINEAVAWASVAGAQGLFLTSLFRARYRYTGVGTARELNSAIFGGPAPMIAAWLVGISGGKPWLVAVMLIVSIALTALGVLIGQARRDDDLDGAQLRVIDDEAGANAST